MLNPSFEKVIIDLLKTHYDLQICNIKELSNEKDSYKTFRFHGKEQKTYSSYPLRMILETRNDKDTEYHSFHIFGEDRNCRSCVSINEKIYPSVIQKALVDIKNEVPKFLMDSRFIYLLGHYNISLISGNYYNNGTDIVVTDVLPLVDTVSNIYFFIPGLSMSSYNFCSVNIKGYKLYIRPIKGYETESTFDSPITLDNDGIDTFKAQFLKCLLIYINSDLYNEADYLNLNYEDLKKYFLVLEMKEI